MSERANAGCSHDNSASIQRRTNISGAGINSRSPHLFIGETVGADDAGIREIPMQALYFRQGRDFDINDRHIGAVPDNKLSQLFDRLCDMDRVEVFIELCSQRLGDSGIGLKEGKV